MAGREKERGKKKKRKEKRKRVEEQVVGRDETRLVERHYVDCNCATSEAN